MQLPQQIKKLREQAGFSQTELAEKIYVSRQTISNWENERSYPDVANLLLLSVLFNVSLDELVKGDVDSMKKKIKSKQEMNIWTWVMIIAIVAESLIGVPAVLTFGLSGGLALVFPIFLVSMFAAFKLEQFKKNNDLKTYAEIVAFYEGRKLPARKSPTGIDRPKIGVVCLVMLIVAALSLFSFWIFWLAT